MGDATSGVFASRLILTERLAKDPASRRLASRERSEGEGLPYSGHPREVGCS
jgi:hypothetical protein